MKKLYLVLALLFAATFGSGAAVHAEHPTGKSEHPTAAKSEHPSEHPTDEGTDTDGTDGEHPSGEHPAAKKTEHPSGEHPR